MLLPAGAQAGLHQAKPALPKTFQTVSLDCRELRINETGLPMAATPRLLCVYAGKGDIEAVTACLDEGVDVNAVEPQVSTDPSAHAPPPVGAR